MLDFLTRRYSLLKFHTFRWLFTFTGPIMAFIYFLVKKPFGFGLFEIGEQIRLALYFSIPVMFLWIIHLFLIQPRLIKKLTILNTILYLFWIHLVIGFYYYSFSEIYIFGGQFDFYWLPMTLKITLLMGLMVTLLMVIIHGGYLIRKRIEKRQFDSTLHRLEEH